MTDRRDFSHLLSLAAIVVGLFAILSFLAPNSYPTTTNLASMAFQMSEVGILALAIGMAFLVGGLDLSVVAVANMAGITAAGVMTWADPRVGAAGSVIAAVLAALAVGIVAGLVNGTLVSRLRVHPIVITLGTLTLFTGIATGLTGGSTVFSPGYLAPLGRGLVAGIPVPFLIFTGLAAMLAVLTIRTRWGYQVYLVGSSDRTSRFSRLAVEKIQLKTYMLSGVLAAIAGLIIVGRTNAPNVSFGSSYLILAILVAVLAGISPYGGLGRIIFVVPAVAAMQQLSTGLNMALAGWEGANFAREFAWGVLLIAVLGLSQRDRDSGIGRLIRSWLPKNGSSTPEPTDNGRSHEAVTEDEARDAEDATQERVAEEERS